MSKFQKGDEVHVQSGIINYIGKIEKIEDNTGADTSEFYGPIIYIINGHCYEDGDLTLITAAKK